MSTASISRSSLVGMVVVSWLSILLLGGVWAGLMLYDFYQESEALRTEYYAMQKRVVQGEVQKAVSIVDEMRREGLASLHNEIRARGARARVMAQVLSREVSSALAPGMVSHVVADVMRAEHVESGLLVDSAGGTIFLIEPFPAQFSRDGALRQIASALRLTDDGERRVALLGEGVQGNYTLLLNIETLSEPPIRIVSGACLEEAEERIKDGVARRLETVSFGKDGYLFGGTGGGISTIGPAKGKNMWEVTDINGVKVVQELVAASNRGGDFVFYVMPKIEGSRNIGKVSYAMPVPDWGWYVGAGLYVDDIEAVIDENRAHLQQDILYHAGLTFVGLILLSLVASAISLRLARKMKRNILAFTTVWNRATVHGEMVDPDALHYNEFKELAVAANRMVEDRREAESKLAESGDRFQTLVSNIPGIVYQCAMDEEWTMYFISDSVRDITGYPPEDFMDMKRSFGSIMDPRDAVWVAKALAEDVRKNQAYSLEYRFVRADGSIRWVFERGQARYDDSGVPYVLDGVIIDITERRQAEEEHYSHMHFLETMERVDRDIRRNDDMEEMLSSIMETIRNGFGADRAWLLFPCDPDESSYKVPFERTLTEYPGAGSWDKDVPIDSQTREVFRAALDSQGPVAFDPASGLEVPKDMVRIFGVKSQLVVAIYPRASRPWLMGLHQCKNARVWSSDEIQLLKEASRRISDALSNALMHRELKSSEEKFRTFSEQTMLGICVVQDDLVKFANQAFCDIFEVSVDEMLALPPGGFLRFVHPDDHTFLAEQARKKQSGDEDVVASYSWRAITSTGKVRWVEIHSKTVMVDDRYADLISLQDITEIRHARQGLEQQVEERTAALANKASELEEAYEQLTVLDELRSSLLSTMSQSMRGPLTSVLGYANHVRMDLAKVFGKEGGGDSKARDRIMGNLAVLEDEALGLRSLVDEFMDYTAIQAGTAHWRDKTVHAEKPLRRAVARGQEHLDDKPQLSLVLDVAGYLPKIHIDPSRMEQVIDVLLDNAIRHTSRGTLTVQAETGEDGAVVITVTDMGPGIPVDALATVFEPFFQLHTPGMQEVTAIGAGLGLALCRGIVEHYGGTVRVESELGVGSSFVVTIPGIPPEDGELPAGM